MPFALACSASQRDRSMSSLPVNTEPEIYARPYHFRASLASRGLALSRSVIDT